jgi:hypothetical protein
MGHRPRIAMKHNFPTNLLMDHRRIRNPDLRLEGTFRDRFEADQEHVVDVHETFTDLPPTFDGLIQGKFLRYRCERLRN